MINLYKLDKASCSKHLAALDGSSIAYYRQHKLGEKQLTDETHNVRVVRPLIKMLLMDHQIASVTSLTKQPERGIIIATLTYYNR